MNPRNLLLSAILLLLTCLLTASARADWKIVPGERIGRIHIGMDHADVIRLLGVPAHEEDLEVTNRTFAIFHGNAGPDLKGVLQDDWITPLPVSLDPNAGDPMFMCNFVTVYFKDRKVVQIEASSPRFKTTDGGSTAGSALEMRKHFPKYQETDGHYHHPSSLGMPAGKHFVDFEDAVREGIAWRYGAMGDLAPDPDPAGKGLECIIVHAPGRPALLDPDGGSRFIWKDSPARRGPNS